MVSVRVAEFKDFRRGLRTGSLATLPHDEKGSVRLISRAG
jgi:hypothetical protein